MGAEQTFWCAVIIGWLAETGFFCWLMERKGKRMQANIKKAETRRKAHMHDYYCTQEAARLYNTFKRSEGGMNNEQIST